MQRLASLVFPLTLLACGSSTSSDSSAVTRSDYDATAQVVGSATLASNGNGDVKSMNDSMQLALGVPPIGISLSADGHYAGNSLGIAFNYALTCEDANGTALALCGPTTDSASVDVSWSGELDTALISTSVQRTGHWTIDGLQGDAASFSGDGTFSFDATIGQLAYTFDADASYDAVLIDSANHQAVGGSAAFDVSATSNNHAFAVHAEVTFNADHTASLVIDGDQDYSINLSSGAVVRVN